MRVKLFDHNDLDGVGCAIVAFHAFGKENVDVEYCNYDDIDEKVREFIESGEYVNYDKVYITDISVNKEVADLIDYSTLEKVEYIDKFQLIDHHNTAKWLNDYHWAFVDDMEMSLNPQESEVKSSGTSLFYEYLQSFGGMDLSHIRDFVEKVRRYDTWEWTTKYDDNHAKQLNDLLYLIGREKFVERFTNNPSINFTDGERLLLETEQRKIEAYIKTKHKQLIEDMLDDYHVGIVYAEQYKSELGNELAKSNPHLDFIIIIDIGSGAVGFRGIHDHIDLGEIAKMFGGGGHPKASGCQIGEYLKYDIWKNALIKNINQ